MLSILHESHCHFYTFNYLTLVNLFVLQATFRGCPDCPHLVEVTLEVILEAILEVPHSLVLPLLGKSILAFQPTLQVRSTIYLLDPSIENVIQA